MIDHSVPTEGNPSDPPARCEPPSTPPSPAGGVPAGHKPAGVPPSTPSSPAGHKPAGVRRRPLLMKILLGGGGFGGVLLAGYFVLRFFGVFGGTLNLPDSRPDLSTPEAAAKSYALFDAQRRLIRNEFDAGIGADFAKAMMETAALYADKSEIEKKVKSAEKHLDAFQKHRKELRDFRVDVIESRDEEGMKQVTLKLSGKELDHDDQKGWFLDDFARENSFTMTKIEGQWKIVEEGGRRDDRRTEKKAEETPAPNQK